MKKFSTLLSVLALMLVSVGVNAQTFANGDYFFYNVEAGGWLGGANSWGTQASIVQHPQRFTLNQVSDGVYTLDSHAYNNKTNHFLNGNFIDGASANCTIADLGDGTYSLTSGTTQLGGATLGAACTTDGTGNVWKIYSEAEMIANLVSGDATDATFLIKGANSSRNLYNRNFEEVWTAQGYNVTAKAANYTLAGGPNENMVSESWRSSNGFNVYQTIQVPNGYYTLKAQAAINNYNKVTENLPVVYANEKSAVFNDMTNGENSMTNMSASFTNGLYGVTVEEVEVTDGKLTVGVKSPLTAVWAVWDNFELTKRYVPTVGKIEFTPADGSKLAADDFTSIKFTYPDFNVREDLGYSASVEWILKEDGKEIKSDVHYIDAAGKEIAVEASTGHVYTLEVYASVNDADGKVVSTQDDVCTITTLNTFELAVAEYENAIADAEALLEYASQHVGLGLKLYLPAKYAKFQKNLETVKALGADYSIYNDYKEGTELVRALMVEFQPQVPKVNQQFLIRHKASGLYLNITDGAKVTLAETGTPVSFHHHDGAMDEAVYFMYNTPERKYVSYAGNDEFTLTNQAVTKAGGLWSINHYCTFDADGAERYAYYTIDGMNGVLGTDATQPGTSVSGNKAKDNLNAHWEILTYVEPELADDELTPGNYLIRNRESGAYLGGANSWGTQASVIEHGIFFTVAVLEDGKYTLDSHTYNNATNHYLGENAFIDSPAFGFTIEPAGNGFFTIANGEQYVNAPAEGSVVVFGEYADKKSQWEFVSAEELIEEGGDLTPLIKAANFSRNHYNKNFEPAWTVQGYDTTDAAANSNLFGGANENCNAESWRSSNGFNIYQTIEVPNGYYTLSAQAAINNYDGVTEGLPVVYANEETVVFNNMTEGESSMTNMSASFTNGLYAVSLGVKVTDGKLTVGVKSPLTAVWAVWDNFVLTASSEAEYAIHAANRIAQATDITETPAVDEAPTEIFSVNGVRLQSMQKGLNIVRVGDKVKKVYVK